MPSLFDPLQMGSLELPNRIVMAPLTRARAGREAVPNELMATYYSQRAAAGLIVSEATGISREGLGWPNAPGSLERGASRRLDQGYSSRPSERRPNCRSALAHGPAGAPERKRDGARVLLGSDRSELRPHL